MLGGREILSEGLSWNSFHVLIQLLRHGEGKREKGFP